MAKATKAKTKLQSQHIVPRIVGYGFSVPAKIRTNDDPIFDWLKTHEPRGTDMFQGYDQRRVLNTGETLMTIMLPACIKALTDAGTQTSEVDMLLGAGSISPFINPNILSQLHRDLELPERCWPIPVCNVYSNFNSSVLMADALIRAGRADTILICVGGNWTRNVDYHTPEAISAGDGAGAIVMQKSDDRTKWTLEDSCTLVDTTYYGGMYTSGDKFDLGVVNEGDVSLYSDHHFHITDLGKQGFIEFGIKAAATSVLNVMKRNNITSDQITLFPNQSSAQLIDPWLKAIKPAQNIDTLKTFANMTVATTVVNFAYAHKWRLITQDYCALMGIGPDMHSNTILMSRESSAT